jgi:hypothetical protein
MDSLKQLSDYWSIAKLAYSALLLAIIWLFLTELWRLWFDQRVFLGRFEFYEKGEAKPTQATSFAFLTLSHQKRLRDALVTERERRTKQGTTWSPPGAEPINIAESALGQVEITIQGVNVGAILQKLREWISPPNQITATIEKGTSGVRAIASWPRGPSRAKGARVDAQFFQIAEKTDESAAALAFACQLAWANSANTKKGPEVPSQEFCDWAQAWLRYLDLREQNRDVGGLQEADVKTVKDLHAFVSLRIKEGAKYPEFRRLRADLFELFPAADRTGDLVAQAQLDSAAYAIAIDPEKRKLSQERANLLAFAQARPAIPVRAGKVQELPMTWADRLAPRIEHLNAAIRATGWVKVLRGSDQVSMSSGFAVGPNLIATASFVLPEKSKNFSGRILRNI